MRRVSWLTARCWLISFCETMGKRCFVPHCRSGHRHSAESVSLFQVPSDPNELKKWSKAIARSNARLNSKCYVCEKHFRPEEIIKNTTIRDKDGKLLFQRIFKRRLLKKGATPSIFPNSPASVLIKIEREASPDGCYIQPPVTGNDTPAQREAPCIKEAVDTKTEPEEKFDAAAERDAEHVVTLFDDIYFGEITPKLPNRSWGFHNCELPQRAIVISQLGKLVQHRDSVPSYVKQIVFDERFNFKVYFLNKWIPMTDVGMNPQKLEQLESLLTYINDITLCSGGPDIHQHGNIESECAYKDIYTNTWRHNLCALKIEGSIVCKFCTSLTKILRRRKQKLTLV